MAATTEIQVLTPPVSGARGGVLAQIWRRRMLFLAVFLATLAATAAAMLLLPVRYLASGSVIVAEQELLPSNASPASTQKLGDPADLESQLLLIRSPRVMRLALARPGVLDAVLDECIFETRNSLLRKLGGSVQDPCSKLLPGSDALLEYVERRYQVGTVGRSRVIAVAYRSPLPEVARTMANALITTYLDDQRATAAQSREATAAWLWQEVQQIDQALREEEAKIQAYRRSNGLVRGANAPISSERLTSISQQLAAAEAAQAEAAARMSELRAGLGRPASDARSVLDSRAVADLKQQLALVTTQLASAWQTLGSKHPTYLALREQRDELQNRLTRETASIASSVQRAYAAAVAQVASLKQQLETVKAEVGTATDSEASIASMVRSAEIKRGLYLDLYKRASDLETQRRVLVGNVRLVSLAELPTIPSFPRRIPFLAAGLTLATMLAAAAALVRDRADRSVRAVAELEAMTGVPVVAQLPLVERRGLSLTLGRSILGWLLPRRRRRVAVQAALSVARHPSVLQDALRGLHARLALAGMGGRLRTLLVTSANPREGKTFTTFALGQLVAASGRRVLVVECDLRCPSFAGALNLKNKGGLSDVLRGALAPDKAVVSTNTPDLDVLPAGEPRADSTELLLRGELSKFLQWTGKYDLVLLDSPPSELLMDARILARQVDAVLCCSRWGHTALADTEATVRGIRAADGKVFGIAVTMVKADEHALYNTRPLPTRPYLIAG